MRDNAADAIKYIYPGEMPRALAWNTMAGILRRDEFIPGQYRTGPFKGQKGYRPPTYDMQHELTAGSVDAFEVVAITGTVVASGFRPCLKTSPYEPTGSGEYNCFINGMKALDSAENKRGYGAYGDYPIIAKLSASPVLGARCGPIHGEKTLKLHEPGFLIVGLSPQWGGSDNLALVVREGGIPYGRGELAVNNNSGESFDLSSVEFFQGLNVATLTAEVPDVYNIYGDAFEVGLICSFIWNCTRRQFEVVSISCPTT